MDDHTRFMNMADAAQKAFEFVKGRRREDLDSDPMFQFALARAIQIIVENTLGISEEFQKQHPGIPWKEIIAAKNHVLHISPSVLWDTATLEIPALLEQFLQINDSKDNTEPGIDRMGKDTESMDLKETARAIFAVAVRAADPYEGIRRFVKIEGDDIVIDGERYPSDRYDKVVVVGGGKASARMGQALEEALGERIAAGWINTKYDHALPLRQITMQECGHPVPDQQGIEGSRKIVELLHAADERTLVICLLSGGGSALMPAPAEGITLEEKQEVTKLLLSAGANIEEINAVRKHLSLLKGGGMARLAAPARLHVLILSDVIGDRLDTIASGPAVADRTTFRDCIDICTRYHILEKLPPAARNRLLNGARGGVPETAKEGDAFLSFARNTIVGNNRMSVEAARNAALTRGYHTLVLSTVIEGEAREVGTVYAALASEIESTGNPIPIPACVIGGGEPTVTIRGKGKGGRNQEMAAKVAERITGMENAAFLSGGTDGTDGPTDAAGGVVDGTTYAAGKEKRLDIHAALADNDSYHYLKAVDGLLVTGPTGTNVMDIHILLVGKPG
ncbi:MAG: DUF4147 domain-containing protein [Candidatus Latescibacterota bacterium]